MYPEGLTLQLELQDVAAAEESPVARGVVVGAAVGIVCFVIGISALAIAVGVPVWSSIGLGAFTALWGGLGFGAMIGGVHALNRMEHQSPEGPRTPSAPV
jgi:hypothetical protein